MAQAASSETLLAGFCVNSQLCIGPGDDAGALRISPGRVLVATTDAMVEGIHFESKVVPRGKVSGEKILQLLI